MADSVKTVVLCTSRIYDPSTHGFIVTLHEKLKTQNIRLWVYALNADIYWDENNISSDAAVFDYIQYDHTDAVIFMDEKVKSKTMASKVIGEAKKRDIPVIVIDGEYEDTININFDYAKGFEQIVRHVIKDHGIRKLHYLAGFKGNKFSEERKEVFKNVLAEYDIPYDEESMVSYGEFWATPARAATQKLIDENRLPEAIICANDVMAINVCDVLKNSGFSVPGDVVVTGFDGYDEVFLMTPGITTVTCDVNALADLAGDLLLDMFGGSRLDCISHFVLPKMYTNESCGCHRCTNRTNVLAMNRFNSNFYRYQDDMQKIHNTTGRMMMAESKSDAISCIENDFAKYMFCVVRKEAFRSDKNYFLEKVPSEGYELVYDSAKVEPDIIPFDIKNVAPRLDEIMSGGYPLIFQSLNYMGKEIGYACYYYQNYDITEYSKTPNITEMIGSGIGGYINMRCQQYLLAKVEEMYKIDALTGLYNRLAFMERFNALKSDPEKAGLALTVIMADLNHLKWINDNLGHEAGDKAIAAVATALKENCPKDSLGVRFGGDEILSFIPGECRVEEILSKVKEDLKNVSEKYGFEVAASCGTYKTSVSEKLNFEDALRHADEQMYIEKQKSRKTE